VVGDHCWKLTLVERGDGSALVLAAVASSVENAPWPPSCWTRIPCSGRVSFEPHVRDPGLRRGIATSPVVRAHLFGAGTVTS
jgi:hypothetical protein